LASRDKIYRKRSVTGTEDGAGRKASRTYRLTRGRVGGGKGKRCAAPIIARRFYEIRKNAPIGDPSHVLFFIESHPRSLHFQDSTARKTYRKAIPPRLYASRKSVSLYADYRDYRRAKDRKERKRGGALTSIAGSFSTLLEMGGSSGRFGRGGERERNPHAAGPPQSARASGISIDVCLTKDAFRFRARAGGRRFSFARRNRPAIPRRIRIDVSSPARGKDWTRDPDASSVHP